MSPSSFSRICLIANPNSSRGGDRVARELRRRLRQAVTVPVSIHLTKRTGHARDFARKLLREDARTLLISVSGDGGYHEVINGAMASGVKKPRCAVFGAGNANDHHQSLYENEDEFLKRLAGGRLRSFDLIRFDIGKGNGKSTVYAHSYGGVGLSAQAAHRLDQEASDPLAEIIGSLRTTAGAPAVPLRVGGRVLAYDSLLVLNVGRMAKYLRTRHRPRASGKRLYLVSLRHRGRLLRMWQVARAFAFGLPTRRVERVTFTTAKPTLLQLDGEVHKLTAETQVGVTRSRQAIRTL